MNTKIVIFGEVLFDCFPDGNIVLGGAPFNVAWHLHALGAPVLFISRIGRDELGQRVKDTMLSWGMDVTGLQDDPVHPTGVVDVALHDGEPQYTISNHRAYDFIDYRAVPNLNSGDMLYHGTLALRNPASAAALAHMKQTLHHTFLDVNLRAPWWQLDDVLQLIYGCEWVKLNQEELYCLIQVGNTIEEKTDYLLSEFKLAGLILTRGAQGASLMTATGETHTICPTQTKTVVDTVGAGDGFCSIMMLGLFQDWPRLRSLQRAQAFASEVIGIQGATIQDRSFYTPFLEQWQ